MLCFCFLLLGDKGPVFVYENDAVFTEEGASQKLHGPCALPSFTGIQVMG